MDGDREDLLGVVLADDVVVENLADLLRGRNTVARFRQRRLVVLADDVHAQLDALGANENARPSNQFAHLLLALAAERAVERVLQIAAADLVHFISPCSTSVGKCDGRGFSTTAPMMKGVFRWDEQS